ncbi:MAG: glycosyltransferase family protein [Eubacterium sp.]|nr:glycosyltransferase family protein [Eubacterium sp.]
MKFLVIIQARCGSTRLPSKVLKDIEGKTALEQMLDRVSRAKKVDEIIVATTINPEDVAIVNLVSGLGYRVFAGSGNDVLDRYYQAAKLLQPEYVIRLTADCPLMDWHLIDEAIDELNPESDDLCSYTETFPDGEDIEIIRFSALEEMWKNAVLASEREHVTLYVKNRPEKYKLQNYECKLGNLNSERWTLDEPEDLELIRAVYKHFAPRTDFSMEEIYRFLQENPEIRNLNQKYIRNEGLIKSLAEDKIVNCE